MTFLGGQIVTADDLNALRADIDRAGVVGTYLDTATASFTTAATTVVQVDDVDLVTTRTYEVVVDHILWRGSTADATVTWSVERRLGAGSWTVIDNYRSTNAVANPGGSSDTFVMAVPFAPPSDGTYDFRVTGVRFAGAGTITTGTCSLTIKDTGPA